MDRLTAFVSIAHLRLRLNIAEKYLLVPDMEIKRPMELVGLRSRLARAKKTEADIEVTGKEYDKTLDIIDELHGVSKAHLGNLKQHASDLKSTIEGMIGGSNSGDPLDGSSDTSPGVPRYSDRNGSA